MMKKVYWLVPMLSALLASQAYAAVSLDRTRVVYPGGAKSMSLTVRNNNTTLPYLAQAWLEDEHGKKLSSPFTILPPVQRLEPGMESMFKVQALPTADKLPQDKESLFYFNMREIPPRSDKPNTLQLALQTRIKFFYRPASLLVEPGSNKAHWQEKVSLQRQGNKAQLQNPTPYYISIVEASMDGKLINSFEPVMLAPHGQATIPHQIGVTAAFVYVDDYGGRQTLNYRCGGVHGCELENVK
ncbi:fimbria/pilus periplasmic chaperone [Aeromonas hydrophila]|uniref:fimbria/pilus periplasmic chaperone n=1 Tax=Aeromonas hydrophila TaxID=644 RepID=UPI001F604FCE|nr:fimbria/pilus periplasmic chaperone [Aeromonas hydrophila]UNU27984.1 fimbria/pilus periplasmic chaperone [Aeromonas hydrophila]